MEEENTIKNEDYQKLSSFESAVVNPNKQTTCVPITK